MKGSSQQCWCCNNHWQGWCFAVNLFRVLYCWNSLGQGLWSTLWPSMGSQLSLLLLLLSLLLLSFSSGSRTSPHSVIPVGPGSHPIKWPKKLLGPTKETKTRIIHVFVTYARIYNEHSNSQHRLTVQGQGTLNARNIRELRQFNI